jgi:hypothetical protein
MHCEQPTVNLKKAKHLKDPPRNFRAKYVTSRGMQAEGPINETMHDLLEHYYGASHLIEEAPFRAGGEK